MQFSSKAASLHDAMPTSVSGIVAVIIPELCGDLSGVNMVYLEEEAYRKGHESELKIAMTAKKILLQFQVKGEKKGRKHKQQLQ